MRAEVASRSLGWPRPDPHSLAETGDNLLLPLPRASAGNAPMKQFARPFVGCANGIVRGTAWGSDADTWNMIDGKLYSFSGQASNDAFDPDERSNLARWPRNVGWKR